MKKPIKYIALILALLFLITGTVMVATAAPDDGGGEVVETPDDGGGVGGDDGGDDGGGDYSGGDGGGDYSGDDGGEDSGADSGDSGSDSGDSGYSGDNGGYDSGSDNEDDQPYYVDNDDSPLWYGESSNYNSSQSVDGPAGAVSDRTSLISASEANQADIEKSQWSDIQLDTTKTGGSNAASFKSIKDDTTTADNGDWMLYVGFALIGLSVLGILYFIVVTVTLRKQNKRNREEQPRYSDSADSTSAARTVKAERPRTGHYADDYDSYSSRRRSKADTGEIYIPRRSR